MTKIEIAKNQIAQYLEVEVSRITKCEEWHKVWFVVVTGQKGRFISKTVIVTSQEQQDIKNGIARAVGKVNDALEDIDEDVLTTVESFAEFSYRFGINSSVQDAMFQEFIKHYTLIQRLALGKVWLAAWKEAKAAAAQ